MSLTDLYVSCYCSETCCLWVWARCIFSIFIIGKREIFLRCFFEGGLYFHIPKSQLTHLWDSKVNSGLESYHVTGARPTEPSTTWTELTSLALSHFSCFHTQFASSVRPRLPLPANSWFAKGQKAGMASKNNLSCYKNRSVLSCPFIPKLVNIKYSNPNKNKHWVKMGGRQGGEE